MPVVSDKHKYIFFCAPLTGSTSLSRTLVDQADGYWAPKADIRDEEGKLLVDKKHGKFSQLVKHEVLPEEKLRSYYKFVGVRNPFDRTVSEYHKMRKLAEMDNPPGFFNKNGRHVRWAVENDFPTYVRIRFTRRLGLLPRKKFSLNDIDIEDMNRFVRTEHLQDDFDIVAKDLNLPEEIKVYDINVTRGERNHEYREYYDKRAQKLVAHHFQDYIERFKYEF